MFFRDVPDKTFDEFHNRNRFLYVLIIFVPIVMESDHITIVFESILEVAMTGRPRYRPIYLITVSRITDGWVWHKHKNLVDVHR